MVILKPLECMGGPRECGLKLLEEASEACEEMKAVEKAQDGLQACDAAGMTCGDYARRDALHELCDVLQCACNCLHALKATPAELDVALLDVRLGNYNRGRAVVRDAPSFTFGLFGPWGVDEEDEEDKEGSDD